MKRYLNNFYSKELVLAYVELDSNDPEDNLFRKDIIKEIDYRGMNPNMFFDWVDRAIKGVL